MDKITNLCLNYHDFSGTKSSSFSYSDYTIDYKNFIDQLEILKVFQNICIRDLISESEIDNLTYSLTFDDGRKSNLYIAEELAKRDLIGTFFIITNECNNNKYLNIGEIKELSQLGMEIGSHSCSHKHLVRLPKEEMFNELQNSKSFLEDIISLPVKSIAFPGGNYGLREIKASIEIGYKINRTTQVGLNILPLNNGIVKGLNIKSNIDLDVFRKLVYLTPSYFLKLKIRELSLALPKYLHSRFILK